MTTAGPAPTPEQDKGGLRTALAGLTTRGRSFLAAGIAAAVCAYVLGQSDLLRVGLLLAVLPLVCATVLYRTRYRVAGSRRLSPARVPAGSEARVHLRMDNVSRLPTGLLMLQDRVPYVLGPRPRFVLDRVEAGGRREVSYRVRSDLRGRYPLGPLQLRLTDPFGMCELTRSFSTYDTLTVIPRVEALSPVRLSGEAKGYGDGRHRSLALAGEDDIIPRGYRHGDDLRRVHWRSTARRGSLMVRREEQPWQSRCALFLDARTGSHHGHGPSSSLEWSVSAAASIGLDVIRRGYVTTMLGGPTTLNAINRRTSADVHHPLSSHQLLVECATIEEHRFAELGALLDVDRQAQEPSLVIAIVGACTDADITALNRWRTNQATGLALLIDSATWTVGADAGTGGTGGLTARIDATEMELRRNGWRIARVRRGDDLLTLWSALGLRTGRIA